MSWQRKLFTRFLIACTTGGALMYRSCCATASTDALTAAIRADKVIEPSAPIRISISGAEADVYTTTSTKATNVERDCKIDAALIAKTVMKTDPTITIVRIWFYEARTNSYREIEVHLGDVASFSSGNINEGQLLKSLKLVVVPAAGSVRSRSSVVLPTNMDVFNQQGLTFYHPIDWVFSTIDNKWFIGQLDHNESGLWTAMQIRKYDNCQSPAMAAGWDAEWWKDHGITVLKRRMRKIGRGNYDALLVDCQDTTVAERYQAHAFFGDKERGVYGLKLLYDRRAAAKVLPVFSAILESVRIGNE